MHTHENSTGITFPLRYAFRIICLRSSSYHMIHTHTLESSDEMLLSLQYISSLLFDIYLRKVECFC